MSGSSDALEQAVAKEAYDAYAQEMGRIEIWKPWVNLTDAEQRAWRAAVRAAKWAAKRVREEQMMVALAEQVGPDQ